MEKEKIRINRLWIAFIDGWTDEGEEQIHHECRPVKFVMPETYENTKGNAIWYYLNMLDSFSTMSEDRMMNAADLPENIVDLIPEKLNRYTFK